MAKKIKLATILPPDTFFYTITLERPRQRLTRETLTEHFPVPKGRKAHWGIHTEYKGFKNGLVSVEVKAPDNSLNIIFLHVGLTELEVACTCGMPEAKLCYHAYMGLHSIATEFDRFYWPGFTEDEHIKNKFLITEVTKNWISVKPKAKYGNLFKSNLGFKHDNQLSIKDHAKAEFVVSGGREAIAYCLAHNVGSRSNLILPVIIPCLGTTSKNNREVVSFKQFGRADKPIANIFYTPNQEMLNAISIRQHTIAKAYDDLSHEEKKRELAILKANMLALWEQAIPLLLNEKYNYAYYTYWLKYLRDKPRKADIRNCRCSLERPTLSFALKYHQDHFTLTAVLSVNGTPLKFDYKPHLFVFGENRLCYLMASVQDDNLLMWLWANNNKLTILKEHFNEFHNTFLAMVSSYYTVLFTDPNTKKAVTYNFEMVSKEIIKTWKATNLNTKN